MTTKTTQTFAATSWALEVVRGRDVGRTFALQAGENLLGNALNGAAGIDLADQEGTSPRRMAGRQARLTCTERSVTVDDLDSPGGTFVNRQRLLPDQSRALQPGDLIQLASVQLKLVEARSAPVTPPPLPPPAASAPPPPSTAPPPIASGDSHVLPKPFTLASGHVCRTYDDFLTIAAQRWAVLRADLISGRLGGFFAANQLSHLVPSPTAQGTPDERLDEWLGRLPVLRPSRPELDVHPQTLVVRATPGGGVTARDIELTNVGYRLLRSTIRVEPPTATWIVLRADVARAPVVTVDRTAVRVELHIPEQWEGTLTGSLAIESNGGTKRVEVRLERPTVGTAAVPQDVSAGGATLGEVLERMSHRQRLLLFSLGAAAQRLIILLGAVLFMGTSLDISLAGAVALDALVGSVIGTLLGRRSGDRRDLPPAAFAGAIAGVLLAAVSVAACATVEPLAPVPNFAISASRVAIWWALGLAAALLSIELVPHRGRDEQ